MLGSFLWCSVVLAVIIALGFYTGAIKYYPRNAPEEEIPPEYRNIKHKGVYISHTDRVYWNMLLRAPEFWLTLIVIITIVIAGLLAINT